MSTGRLLRTVKGVTGSILSLGARYTWVVKSTPPLLYPRENNTPYLLYGRLDGRCREATNLLRPLGIERLLLGRPDHRDMKRAGQITE